MNGRRSHRDGEAEKFYRELKAAGCKVGVGMEASGHARWFERLLAELGFELWSGDPGQMKAQRVRRQKTDRLDAALCCSCCWRMAFLGCGYPVRKIETCVSCCGKHVPQSTKQGNKTVACQMAAMHRSELAKGNYGIGERKPVATGY